MASFLISFRLKDAEVGCSLLLECDSTVKDSVLKHLKLYKLRRKVNIKPCPELTVWAVLPRDKVAGCQEIPNITPPEQALVCEADPRNAAIGWRLVADSKVNPMDLILSCQLGDLEDYHKHRYAIGRAKTICTYYYIIDFVCEFEHTLSLTLCLSSNANVIASCHC